jgi:membrane protease YdiL (CAAX protease family)
MTAALGEEIFFRGFVQQAFGLWAGALAFMACHLGAKDIRVISYWSLAQGLWLGIFFSATGNLLVPMLAHGLFDVGGMIYFRWFLARPQPACGS